MKADATGPAVPAPPSDRRDPRRQCRIPGGSRASDPPLTTRACADWMGLTTAWVRLAITEGVVTRGVCVKLEAETLKINNRRIHRIHLDKFIDFLRAVGWKRIPKSPVTIVPAAQLSE
jgi:hypothetical protein